MNAQAKLRRALDIFAVSGSITTEFNKDDLILTINGVPFLPSETHALNILYREEVGYQHFMEMVTKTEEGKEAKRYITPIFDLRSSLYEDPRNTQAADEEVTDEEVTDEEVSESYDDAIISILLPHLVQLLRGV